MLRLLKYHFYYNIAIVQLKGATDFSLFPSAISICKLNRSRGAWGQFKYLVCV